MLMRQPCWGCQTVTKAGNSDFRSYMGTHAMLAAKGVKPGCAVNAITIEQGHGRHLQRGSSLDKFFRQRSRFQKAEGAGRMQFNVALSHTEPLSAIVLAEDRASGSSKARLHRVPWPPDPIVRATRGWVSTNLQRKTKDHKPAQ